MNKEEFYDKMDYYFADTPKFDKYSTLNELTNQFVSQLSVIPNLKLISISSGKVVKDHIYPPHIILLCNKEGSKILDNLLFELQCELFDKRTIIRYMDQVVTGICIEFNYSVKLKRSIYRDYKKWWNILFKLFNKYYGVKIRLHRTW